MRIDILTLFPETLGDVLSESILGRAQERGFIRIETVGRFPCNGEALIPKNTVGWERGHMHCYYSFLDSVNKGERPSCGIDEGAKLQCLMEKMFESDREGRWVEA